MEHTSFEIRGLTVSEYPLLDTFLYEAIFIPEGMEPPPFSIIRTPDLQVYVQDFGRSVHDRALAAVSGGEVIGVVWVRIMEDYGHLDDDTPSLAISLRPEYRGQGIGTALMLAMLGTLQAAGYTRVSLSVQEANAALRLYRRLGFTPVRVHDGEQILCCALRPFWIRTLLPGDFPQVDALLHSCQGMGLNHLDDSAEGFVRFLDRNPTTCFAAVRDGRLVGVIMAGHDGRRGYLYHTAVHPEYRHMGIGTALTGQALKALEACGIHKAALVVFARNETGNAFWEHMGFTTREDLVYRNYTITPMQRTET